MSSIKTENEYNYSYNGNQNLRPAGAPIDITAEQTSEIIKCMQDPVYFCEHYLQIVTLDHGLQPFVPRPYQKDAIKLIVENRFILVKQSRQSGKTSLAAAILLWYTLFNPTFTIAVLAHKQDQAVEILDRIKLYFQNLPIWLQLGIGSWDRKSIKFENGSTIFAAATTSGSVVGKSINILYSDEFDLIPLNLQEEFYGATMPTISGGTTSKFIITTTPRGFKYFYKLWTESEQGINEFERFTINWWDVPGRDEEWKAKEIGRIGEAKFKREYVTDFIGSSNTLIDGDKLKNISFNTPIKRDEADCLNLFALPEQGKKYLLSADVSEGVGGDASTFVITDVSQIPYQVVGTFVNDMIDTLVFPQVIWDLAKYYNNAYVVVEANAMGKQVLDILYHDLEYENILTTTIKGQRTDVSEGPEREQMGMKQTKRTKQVGTSALKSLIENEQLLINDFRIFYELSRFVRKGSSFQAEPNEHDDLVMALCNFAYMTTQNTFMELTNTSTKNTLNKKQMFDNDFIPLGIFSNNTENDLQQDMVISDFDKWMLD